MACTVEPGFALGLGLPPQFQAFLTAARQLGSTVDATRKKQEEEAAAKKTQEEAAAKSKQEEVAAKAKQQEAAAQKKHEEEAAAANKNGGSLGVAGFQESVVPDAQLASPALKASLSAW